MPKVPTYGQQQIQSQVGPQIRVRPNAPIEAFGGGQAFQESTNAMIGIAKEAKDDADKLAVLSAEKEINDFEKDFTFGKRDSSGNVIYEGAVNKKGINSFGLQKELDDEYKKKYDELSSKLTKDQMDLFGPRAHGRKMGMDNSVSKHVSAEIQQYETSTIGAYIKSEQGAAISNYHNIDRLKSSLYNQKEAVLEYAKKMGSSPDVTQKAMIETLGGTHIGVISRMIDNGDDITAQRYFNQFKDQIPGEKLGDIEKVIESGARKGISQRFVDQVLKTGASEKDAYSLAESKFKNDPKLREEAEARIARQYDLKRQGEQDYQNQLFEKATSWFDQNGTTDGVTTVVSSMDSKTRLALDSYIERNPMRDDTESYYKLYDMAQDPDTREKFANYDLLLEKGNLSKENFEKLMKIKADIKNGNLDDINGAYSDAQVAQSVYESAGFDTDKKAEFSKYKLQVDKAIEDMKMSTGRKKLTSEEVEKISSDLTVQQVVKKGWIWDTKKPKFLIDIDSVPKDDVNLIKEALKKRGKAQTEQNIIAWYLKRQEQ